MLAGFSPERLRRLQLASALGANPEDLDSWLDQLRQAVASAGTGAGAAGGMDPRLAQMVLSGNLDPRNVLSGVSGGLAVGGGAGAPAPGARELNFDPFELRSRVSGQTQLSAPAFDPGDDEFETALAEGNPVEAGYAASFPEAGGMANQVGPRLTRAKKRKKSKFCDKKQYPPGGKHPSKGRPRPVPIPGAGVRKFYDRKDADAQLQMARVVRPHILRATWADPNNPVEVGVKFFSKIDKKGKETFWYTNGVTQHLLEHVSLTQKKPAGVNDVGDIHSHVVLACDFTPGGNPKPSHGDRPSNRHRRNFVVVGLRGELYEVTGWGSYKKI